ncbi:hypothetical protein JW977_01180 [Candidatus Falkowbacteria bacterium]|nr:hypothetical protein [Candidatus Falkowbacteria bacterium]
MNFSFIDEVFDPLQKKLVKRWVLELPGAGCEWYKKTGGCTMCGFNQSTYKFTFGGHLYPHFIFMLLFYYAYSLVKKQKPEQLVIYNGGSFLSDKEIPLKTQLAILRFVKKHPTLQKIMVESRAEFATPEKLRQYHPAIFGKKLEIAFGLESANNEVRNKCLKKGLGREVFENAVKDTKSFGFQAFAYVFLKPHCLNEEEAVNDAINSIRYCFDKDIDEVSLSCAFVQKGTPLHALYQRGEFQPPTLRSIVRVIEATHLFGPVRIGSFDDEPPPLAKPSNNDDTDLLYEQAIHLYRRTHDVKVFEILMPGGID